MSGSLTEREAKDRVPSTVLPLLISGFTSLAASGVSEAFVLDLIRGSVAVNVIEGSCLGFGGVEEVDLDAGSGDPVVDLADKPEPESNKPSGDVDECASELASGDSLLRLFE